ncbi:MAG TPA: PQQ-dependent sugar dehydrogenase [Kofleriaceae bacterium]|nr:PQQ-dependent sugar dehydrogenase [Kofleriaceae bacterium]
MGKLYPCAMVIAWGLWVGSWVGCTTDRAPDVVRPQNQTCLAPARPATPISIERAFVGLAFDRPIQIAATPDGRWWFVIEREGKIWRFANDPDATEAELVLDLSAVVESTGDGDGLLAFALHPRFAETGELFVSYTAASPIAARESRVSRFRSLDGGATFGDEDILLALDQVGDVHVNAGMTFGTDGMLYIGFGDGGIFEGQNAQDLSNLRGGVLRIDVDTTTGRLPYGIPSDNPFRTSSSAAPELWASGLRNPWRITVDRATGELWAGDVGLGLWEEIDRVERGGNYGWPLFEGAQCTNIGSCDDAGFAAPMIAVSHDEASSITAGLVYRGTEIPDLAGQLVFGDFVTGYLWAFDPSAPDAGKRVLAADGHAIVSFAEDAAGELYLVDYQDGTLWRLTASRAGPDAPLDVPATLAETGCFDETGAPAPGLIPYDINWPFWSGDVTKRRWLAIPDGTTIDVDSDGELVFPIGSVLVKEFAIAPGLRIETRLLVRHEDGDWAGYTYVWDGYQDVARLLPSTATTVVQWDADHAWAYPRRTECMRCHTRAAGRTIGPHLAQLDREVAIPAAGATNQLAYFARMGLFSEPLPAERVPLPDVADETASLEARARAWLHANCAYCHRPGFSAVANMDLRFGTPLEETQLCNVPPTRGDLGITDARRLVPGDPARSIVMSRITRRDGYAMPPSAYAPDAAGLRLVEAWIESLERCPDDVDEPADPGGVASQH